MTSEVIVDVQPKEISIALLEDKRLVEFQKEGRSASFVVGNIYLAKVALNSTLTPNTSNK